MARFVLIHGAWQAAWCWDAVVPLLIARGHQAVAFDLPGHGADPTPLESVTMQDYVNRTTQIVLASGESAIVVGNSMAGGIISQVAEGIPERVRALVYVAALVPPDRTPMLEFVARYDPEFTAEFVWSPDRRTAGITHEGARRFLYERCPDAIVRQVLPRLTPEPVAPFEAHLALPSQHYGNVPRYYVECLHDKAVPLRLQRTMHSSVAFERVYSIDTDHSPFFSAPEGLARILNEIAEQTRRPDRSATSR